MSYQNGSASGPVDLVQQLVTWLVSIGWTQDRSATEGAGWTASLGKDSATVHFRAAINESSGIWANMFSGAHYGLHMTYGTGFNSGQPFANQNIGSPVGSGGAAVGVGMPLASGTIPNYFFFADSSGDHVVIIVERSGGIYNHLGFGPSLQKAGSWTGGPYFFGTCSGYYTSISVSLPSLVPGFTKTADCPGTNQDSQSAVQTFVRADVDSFTGKWISIISAGVTPGADQGYQGKRGDTSVIGSSGSPLTAVPTYQISKLNAELQTMLTSRLDGRANLLPVYLYANRDGTSTGYSLLGAIPFVVVSNAVGNGFSQEDEYPLGSATYKLFPNFAVQKQ